MVAGEVKRPERSLPIALIAGVGVVGVLYMATNAATQYILPADQIASSARPAAVAMSVVSGSWGAALVSVAMALSILVGLNGTTMSGARVPFAAARDRLFPAWMAHIHPRFQSPSTALVAQGLLSTLLLYWWDVSSSCSSLRFLRSGSSTCLLPRRSLFIGDAFLRRSGLSGVGVIRFCRCFSFWPPGFCCITRLPATCAAQCWERSLSLPVYRFTWCSEAQTERRANRCENQSENQSGSKHWFGIE